ncbi:O-antigen ligase family protein [Conexibacter sp. DBS9H8]|uniref:O-antigen ligase family protein n=1 Tax=Conexibacter sp. DBS9H8 TaxID=2937801 RepID=UPI00201038D2|nr:O-antigen ligase family protein [Conexibacter sp. DBS9H8]
MLVLSVVTGSPLKLGVILLALLAGAVLVLQGDRRRAGAMLLALVFAPALLLGDIWGSPQLDVVRRHPLVAVAAALIGLLAVIAVAVLLARHRQWIAPLALAALPFRVPISVSGATYNLLVPLYFVVAAAALSWLVPILAHPERAGRRRPAHRFEWLLALTVVLYAIQAWYSAHFGTLDGFAAALRNLTFFYVPFAMLAALLRDLDWGEALVRRCLIVLGALALIFSAVGFWEEATGTVLLNPKLIAANQVHPYFTVNSVFFDPDIFGRFLAIVMILGAAVLIYRRRPAEVLTSAVVLAILWGCLVLTLSRSSLGALLVGMAVLAAFRWNATRLVVGAFAVALLVGGIALAITPKTFGLNQGLNGASSGRASLISGGAQMFAARPLTGYGSGAFEAEYAKRHGGSCGTVCASHTIAVTIAAEQGLIGLIPYIALLVSAIVTLFRGARGDPVRVAIAAALLALLFHTQLYADFLEDPTTWVLLAVGGALAHRWADTRESDRRSARQARRQLAPTT